MTARTTLDDLALEAELHALGIRDLHTRSAAKELKRTEDQVAEYDRRASRAEAIAAIFKKLQPREAAFREFLRGGQ